MKIYLDIDGTLIHEDNWNKEKQTANGIEEFIIALRKHETYWLTTHCRDGNPDRAREIMKSHLPIEFHGDIDRIKPTTWDTLKIQGIDWESQFTWFDNDISDIEWERFAMADEGQQVFEVNLVENPDQLIEITRNVL